MVQFAMGAIAALVSAWCDRFKEQKRVAAEKETGFLLWA